MSSDLESENVGLKSMLANHQALIKLLERKLKKQQKAEEDCRSYLQLRAEIDDLKEKNKEINKQNDRWFEAFHSAISMAFHYMKKDKADRKAELWIDKHCKQYYSEMRNKRME